MTLHVVGSETLLPQEEVVALAEKILADAKSGQLRALAYVGAFPDGATIADWSAETGYSPQMMAAISDLFHRYAQMRLQVTIEANDEQAGA